MTGDRDTFEIRPAGAEDAPVISRLVTRTVRRYNLGDCTAAGAEAFLAALSTAAYLERMGGECRYHVAVEGDDILGMIGIRGESHLHHLFVAEEALGRGIGRALWIAARDAAIARHGTRMFTVNSSSYAVGFYERLGFVATGAAFERDGVTAVPMRLETGVPETDSA